MDEQKRFRDLAIAAGAKDLLRVLASGSLAVRNGDNPQKVLACLLRNRPELFKAKPAATQPAQWRKRF